MIEFVAHGRAIALYLPDPGDPVQERIRLRRGFADAELLEELRPRLRPDDLVVDVRAHVGNHAVYLAAVAGARVLAFEPQTELHAVLCRNIELNRLQDRITAINAALGRPGSPTLDAQVGDQRVALLRLDVPGFETAILDGAGALLERDHPMVCVRTPDAPARKSVENALLARGYIVATEVGDAPLFVHCSSDEQRFAVLSARVSRDHRELTTALQRMAHESERKLEDIIRRLEAASPKNDAQTALLYELWNLGLHNQNRALVGPGRYAPLNETAEKVVDWRPQKRSWTVPQGTEAEPFLQGFADRVSVHAGESIGFRMSTDRPALFVIVRVFRIGQGHGGGEQVHRSQPIAVPRTGVWRRGGADVDLDRWQVVYRLPIEDGWKPGAYLARFETLDGKANQHPFWVTSKRPTTGTVMLASVLSHVAGNRWGRSRAQRLAARLPERARPLLGRLPVPVRQRLHTVRLLAPHNGSRGGRVLLHEVPFLRWAEANKLALDCITDVELHQQPELLAGWQQVVIAGDARCMTRPVLEALRAHRDRGGSIAVLGAAPGEELCDLDVDAGTVTLGGEPPPAALDAELWGAERGAPADAGDLRFLDRPLTGAGLPAAAGLCGDRTSRSRLADDDPALLARGPGCDTVLATTAAGGRLFIAGTDRWTWALDDFIDRPVDVSPAVRELTARVLGLRGDSYQWEPLVSVIMTAYNSAEHLQRAVDSILAQSYRNFELIIVDDASTDGTFQALVDLAARDPRVRPLRSSRNHGTYWCKNLAITRARGELLTFQDSDDVSDPERLATQVGALRRNPAAVCAMVDYIRVDATGQTLINRGRTQRCAIMAPMFRAEPVRARAGFFDSVRGGADQEFYHRLHLAFPDADIIETHQPLYHALARWGSLTRTTDSFVDLGADEAPDRLAHLSPDRRAYVIAYEEWHKKVERGQGTPYLAFPPAERPFPVPARLGVDSGRTQPDLDLDAVPATPAEPLRLVREPGPAAATAWTAPPTIERVDRPGEATAARPRPARGAAYEADVVLLSDFRFPGGTSASNAEEIKAQARGGLTTLLAQVNSPVLRRNHPTNPLIRACVDAGMAEMLPARTPARCKLLVIRHPSVLHSPDLPRIDAERVLVIVNQPPADDRAGQPQYDMLACQAAVRRQFGQTGSWLPIGPLVRKEIAGIPGMVGLADGDWNNIIDIDEWRVPRTGWVADRPVIGRHSRNSPDKWPADAATLLAAYPDDPGILVRVLGGAEHARKLLGYLPANWQTLEFGTMPVRDFLSTIDFFVYYHHPQWVESFGRTILEAMACGAPAILPHHFAELFEDVALYAEPAEVRARVLELYADRAAYQERSRRGVDFVQRRFSHAAHLERVRALIDSAPAPQVEVAAAATLARPRGGTDLGGADLEPDSVYRVLAEIADWPREARGRIVGVSAATGQPLFELAIDGSQRQAGTFLFTEGRPDRVDARLHLDGGNGHAPRVELRFKRRADRPPRPQLELSERSVTAAMATYPGRREIIPTVIDTLIGQVDKLFIYLNNYDDVPDFIRRHPHRDRIVYVVDPASQRRAAAKFYWLDQVRGYHLICDDDILYPPDYAARMVDTLDRHGRRAIAGVHGVVFASEVEDARTSRRDVFKFFNGLERETPVHFLGTGTVALHSDVLAAINLPALHAYPIANDEILAVSAKDAGIPMVCVARAEQWMRPHPDVKFGIFEERSVDTAEHDRATGLLASANPWPDLSP